MTFPSLRVASGQPEYPVRLAVECCLGWLLTDVFLGTANCGVSA